MAKVCIGSVSVLEDRRNVPMRFRVTGYGFKCRLEFARDGNFSVKTWVEDYSVPVYADDDTDREDLLAVVCIHGNCYASQYRGFLNSHEFCEEVEDSRIEIDAGTILNLVRSAIGPVAQAVAKRLAEQEVTTPDLATQTQ